MLRSAEDYPGKLFIVEGVDGSGKSTQIELLHKWLLSQGYSTFFSEWNSSPLVRRTTRRGKDKHLLTPLTFSLIHATDFADRLEMELIPAMRAGYVVLTDRYVYSLQARATVRGMDPEWIRRLYDFAPTPDIVLYLKISMDKLIPRVLSSGGFDYWESGMDYLHEATLYDAFVKHQGAVLKQFEQLCAKHDFTIIDAEQSIREVFDDLQEEVEELVAEMAGVQEMSDFVAPVIPTPKPADEERRSVADSLRDLLSSFLED